MEKAKTAEWITEHKKEYIELIENGRFVYPGGNINLTNTEYHEMIVNAYKEWELYWKEYLTGKKSNKVLLDELDYLLENIKLFEDCQNNPFDFFNTLSKQKVSTNEFDKMTKIIDELSTGFYLRSKERYDEYMTKCDEIISSKTKIGRNSICFCGSGKKYKHCHGKNM